MRAVDAHLLVEDEALVEVGIGKLATLLLDDLDVLEVGRSLFECMLTVSARGRREKGGRRSAP